MVKKMTVHDLVDTSGNQYAEFVYQNGDIGKVNLSEDPQSTLASIFDTVIQ